MTDDRRIRPARALGAGTRRAVMVASPWVAILVITGGFHLYRGAIADGVVYLVVAAAVMLDAAGVLRLGHSARRQRPLGLLLGCSAILAVPLVVSPLYGTVNTVVVAATGFVVFILSWPDPDTAPAGRLEGRAHRRAAILWTCIGLAFCLWELAAYFLGRPSAAAQYAFPALSDLVDPIIQTATGRAALVSLWFLGGVALLRRGRRP